MSRSKSVESFPKNTNKTGEFDTDNSSSNDKDKKQFSSALNSFKSRMESFAKKAVEFKDAALEKSSEWSVKAKEAAAKLSKRDQELSTSSIYKMSLAQCVKLSAVPEAPKVPVIVYRCIEYLDQKGLEEVGIYRVSGSMVTVNNLKKLFENGQDVDLEETGADVNAVASLLRFYLRELPENILTSSLEPRFSSLNDKLPNASGRNSIDEYRPRSFSSVDDTVIERLADLCLLLPPENYHVLSLLFRHLNKVASMESVNKMGISNLQVIFGPSLNIPNVILGIFISHAFQIFTTSAVQPVSNLRKSSTVNGALMHYKPNKGKKEPLDLVHSPLTEVESSAFVSSQNDIQGPPPKPLRSSSKHSLMS